MAYDKVPKRNQKAVRQKWVRSFIASDPRKLHLVIDLLIAGANITKCGNSSALLNGSDGHSFKIPHSVYKFLLSSGCIVKFGANKRHKRIEKLYVLNRNADYQQFRDVSELKQLQDSESLERFKTKMKSFLNKTDIPLK